MSRTIIGYKEELNDKYVITPVEWNIIQEHSNTQNNYSEMFLSDKRMDEIKEMMKSL